jgi:hypothetical protein
MPVAAAPMAATAASSSAWRRPVMKTRALCSQFLRGGQADASGAAGDQCDFAVELLVHDLLR